MTPYYADDSVSIYHGDCREITPLLEFDVVLADPPYGIALDTDYTRFLNRSNTYEPVRGDDEPFDPAPWLDHRVMLWGANHYAPRLPRGGWLVWDKVLLNGMGHVLSDAEMAWTNCYTKVRVFRHLWRGNLRASESGFFVHPTQKPVALMDYALSLIAKDGDTVLDPFMGSGPTMEAAKRRGLRAIGIEIEERYCEIAANRCRQETLGLLA